LRLRDYLNRTQETQMPRSCRSPGYRFRLTAVAILFSSGAVAFAQAPGQSSPPSLKNTTTSEKAPRLGPTDISFLVRAAEGGLYEVAAGRLAASGGNHEQVRAFGEKLASDHAGSNARLAQLARDHAVALPGVISARHEVVLERLRKLSGPAFDRPFVQTLGIDDHRGR